LKKIDESKQSNVAIEATMNELEVNTECVDVIEYIIPDTESDFNKEKLQARTKFLNAIDTNLDLLSKNIKCLNHRCEQFNDVKSSIRQTNDLIKGDLDSSFGTVENLMRIKLKEMTDCVKEKLKNAYSVVKDTQSKIKSKIEEVKALTDQIKALRSKLESLGNKSLGIKSQSSHDLGQELPFYAKLDKDDYEKELGKHKKIILLELN
jgi:archaellum component FlaC